MNGYRTPFIWWICADCGLPMQRDKFCEDCGGIGIQLTGAGEIIRRHDA